MKSFKILVGYPPLKIEKGKRATLGQNRQYQEFSNPISILPIVPASAATLLKSKNNNVIWKDSIAEDLSFEQFFNFLKKESPDLFLFETKTPVIKQHWQTINKLKEFFPKLKITICGDHVTYLPEETLNNSKADYVLTGGDYDFLLLNLVEHLTKKKKLEPGIYYKEKGKVKSSGKFKLSHNLDDLPFIDRELIPFHLYQTEYNIKVRPFAYIMSARDCWWGNCSFCAWPQLYTKFRQRSVKNVLDEIGMLIQKYSVKEIFDDSGTLPKGIWLKELCNGLIERGYNEKITYSCNMRFNALTQEDFNLMKKANFRLLKFGLESANQITLDTLNKGIKVQDIIDGCGMAKKAGLTVHLTMIMGYPWETRKEALITLNLAKRLMQSGLADVLQSTILIPYPGTKLWLDAKKEDLFNFNPESYERYNMKEPVLKTLDMSPQEIMKICNSIYRIFITPKYILRHITKLKSFNDIKYTLKGVKAVMGHKKDFSK